MSYCGSFLLQATVSDTGFEDTPSPGQPHALEYENYDVFQSSRRIDVIIDDKLYLGE